MHEVHVSDYEGAFISDRQAIVAAIAAAATQRATVVFDAKAYTIDREIRLTVPGGHVSLQGVPYVNGQKTVIRASTSMRAVISIAGGHLLKDIEFDAARTAMHAIHCQGCSHTSFERIGAVNAIRDGVYLSGETDGTWPWPPSTPCFVDMRVHSNGNIYECIVSGISASSGGPSGTGGAITDGTVTWRYLGPALNWTPSTPYAAGDVVQNEQPDDDAIIASGVTSSTSAQTISGAGLSGAAGGAAMSPPRRLNLTLSNHADWEAATITVNGTGPSGAPQSEDFAVPNGGNTTLTGSKLFSQVTSVAIPAQRGTGGTLLAGTIDESVYECTMPGTSAASGGPTGTDQAIVDGAGALRWRFVCVARQYAINDLNTWLASGTGFNGKAWVTWALDPSNTNPPSEAKNENDFFLVSQREQATGASAQVHLNESYIDVSGIDLLTLGLRAGDFVRVALGRQKRMRMIVAPPTISSRLQVDVNLDFDQEGLEFAILSGDGYREEHHGDNNKNTFFGGVYRGNVGAAFAFNGLYGGAVYNALIDYNGYGVRVGGPTGGDACISGLVANCYFEKLHAGKPFKLVSAQNWTILAPTDNGSGGPGANVDYSDVGGSGAFARGFYVNDGGIHPIGSPFHYKNWLPTAVLHDATSFDGLTFAGRGLIKDYPHAGYAYKEKDTWSIVANYNEFQPGNLEHDELEGPISGPVIAVRPGMLLALTVAPSATGSVTLVSEYQKPGTKLYLKTNKVTLKARDTLFLFGVLDGWMEVGRSGHQSSRYFNAGRSAYTGAETTNVGLEHKADVANSALAVAHAFDNATNLTTAGALLASFRREGVQKAAIDKDGQLSISGAAAEAEAIRIPPDTYIRLNDTGSLADPKLGFWSAIGEIVLTNIQKSHRIGFAPGTGNVYLSGVLTVGSKVVSTSGSFQPSNGGQLKLESLVSDNGGAVGVLIENVYALSSTGAKIASFRNAGTEKAAVDKDGGVVAGAGLDYATRIKCTAKGDSSSTPGDATLNVGAGRSALEDGTDECVITSDKVSADSIVLVMWEDLPPSIWSVTPSNGSFMVKVGQNASGHTKFRWSVVA